MADLPMATEPHRVIARYKAGWLLPSPDML